MNRRITKPPGGETSDIFAASPVTTPPGTPRKVKNYMASNIFTPVEEGNNKGLRQRKDADSFKRLFGGNNAKNDGSDGVDGTPTVKKNHQKSNIIFSEEKKAAQNGNGHIGTNGYVSPKALVGDGHDSGSSSGNSSGSVTPNGSATPNGSVNGDAEPPRTTTNGNIHGTPTRSRIPPGGFSTKLW